MRSRWFLLSVAVVLLGGPACGGDDGAAPEKEATETGGVTGPQTFRVKIDGDSPDFNGAFLAFLPNDPAAHAGDTVTFELPHFTGEPHTVTFGTLVDTAVAKLKEVGTSITYSQRENLPEMLKLTDVFPHKVGTEPPEVNQAAAAPCYLDAGEPPFPLEGSGPACPKRDQPEFNGRQTFYNSGVLQSDGDSFSVKLAGDIAPGSYSFMCLVHRTLMRGDLKVAAAKEAVPSPDEVTLAGNDQFDELTNELKPEADAVAKAPATGPVAGSESAVLFKQTAEPSNAEVAEFGPKDLSVPVGGAIIWTVRFFHTIAVNAPEEAVGLLTKAADGSFHINPAGFFPADSPLPPDDYLNFPPTADKPITIDGKSFTGAFKSSGLLGSIPPSLISYKVSFPKAGTYTLRCLLHPDMKGRIKVG